MSSVVDHPGLLAVLEESKRLGFLGPGPVADHIEHALRFLPPLDALATGRGGGGGLHFADLGAGGGLPSLPLLVARPDWSAVLIDAIQKRCSFLVWAVAELGVADRAVVWNGRAEEIGHEGRARFGFDAVVARGFGPPAATVECAAPLLVVGGRLVISEPPEGRAWPAEPLALIGLVEASVGTAPSDGSVSGVVVLERVGPVPDEYPRPTKVARRSPLW